MQQKNIYICIGEFEHKNKAIVNWLVIASKLHNIDLVRYVKKC